MTQIPPNTGPQGLARRRVPKLFFDYADSGAWTEGTYRANAGGLSPGSSCVSGCCRHVDGRSKRRWIGQKVSMPVALAPTGLTGMQHATARCWRPAPRLRRPVYVVDHEHLLDRDVASVTTKPFWSSSNVMRERRIVLNLIDRAKAPSCSALVLTLDLQILGPAP